MVHNSKLLLNCEYLNHGNMHKTHVDGHFYQQPSKFPCILHDKNGCIFITKEKYIELVDLNIFRESNRGKLNVKDDISKILGYTICSQKKNCPKYNAKNINSKKEKKQKDKIDKILAQFLKLHPDQQEAIKKQCGII